MSTIVENSSLLRPPRLSPARRGLLAMAAGCLVGTWALVALVTVLLVRTATDQAREAAQNTSAMAAAYVRQSLDAGALVLHGMEALLAEKGVHDEDTYRAFLDGPAATQVLRDRIANMKEVDKAAFISRTGQVLNFSVVYPPPSINVADRDYFREQMGEAPPRRSLSAAVLDRSSGKWTFFLAQRLRGGPPGGVARGALLAQERGPAEGQPFGLAIVGIRASLLSDFFGQNRLGEPGMVLLLRDDDVLLAGAGVPPSAYGQKFALAASAALGVERVSGFPARVVVTAAPVNEMKVLRGALPLTAGLGAMISAVVLLFLWRALRTV